VIAAHTFSLMKNSDIVERFFAKAENGAKEGKLAAPMRRDREFFLSSDVCLYVCLSVSPV